MRSYRQHCALAKALDVVGDRWSLLIVRELLLRDRCRYTDLRNGLPGIATNLLAERLKELESTGIIRREEAPPPVATTLFRLTERGRALEPVIFQLGQWGAPLLATPAKTDHFRVYWLGLWMRHGLRDHAPKKPAVTIALNAGEDEPLTLEAAGGTVNVRVGRFDHPHATLAGPPRLLASVLTGKTTLSAARASGVRYAGDPRVLARVQPLAVRKPK